MFPDSVLLAAGWSLGGAHAKASCCSQHCVIHLVIWKDVVPYDAC